MTKRRTKRFTTHDSVFEVTTNGNGKAKLTRPAPRRKRKRKASNPAA